MNGGLPHPLATLRAGWKIILAAVVVIVLLGGAYAHTRTRTYESLMQLQLVSDPTTATTTNGASTTLLDVRNLATGDIVIDDAAKKLQVTPAVLRAHLKVAAQGDSDTILVQVEGRYPAEAEFAVKTVANSMVALAGKSAENSDLAQYQQLSTYAQAQYTIAHDPKSSGAQIAASSGLYTLLYGKAGEYLLAAQASGSDLTTVTADPTPGAPEGTSTSTSVAIAAILGVLLGSAIVLGRASLRRTVDRSEMVAGGAVEGVPVLGIIGRKGKQDVTADVLLDVLVAARAAEPNHETLVVAGLTRDAPSRDLARALADLSAKGQATVLVDADLGSDGRPAASPADGAGRRPQLVDLLRRARAGTGRNEVFPRPDATVPAGTAPLVVPAGEAYGETTALLPYVPRVLDRMREQAEVVIAIAPPLNTAAGRSVAASADVVVVVTTEKRTRRADLSILANGPIPAATQVIGLVAIADAWGRPDTQPSRPVHGGAPQPPAPAPAAPAAPVAPVAPVVPMGDATATERPAVAAAPAQSRPQPVPAQPRPAAAAQPASAAAPPPVPAPPASGTPSPASESGAAETDFRPPPATPTAVPQSTAPSATPAAEIEPWPEARPAPFGDTWPKVDLIPPTERDSHWDVDGEWGIGWTTQTDGNGSTNTTATVNGTGGTVPNGTSTTANGTNGAASSNGGVRREPMTGGTAAQRAGRHPRPPWNRFTRDR